MNHWQSVVVIPFHTVMTHLAQSFSFSTTSCDYLARKLTGTPLAEHAVCLGDDDNDIEMALACRHAFIPTVTSNTMADTLARHPGQFTAIRGLQDTEATEAALRELLAMLQREDGQS